MPRTNQERAVLGAVAGLTASVALSMGPIYEDATYRYFGEALPGAALTDAVWRVSRQAKTGGKVEWVGGTGELNNVFTSLNVVSALVFA